MAYCDSSMTDNQYCMNNTTELYIRYLEEFNLFTSTGDLYKKLGLSDLFEGIQIHPLHWTAEVKYGALVKIIK